MKTVTNVFKLMLLVCISAVIVSCEKEDEKEGKKATLIYDQIDLVLVKGGTFTQGATGEVGDDIERPAHQVTLHDYYIARLEVTQKQWFDVLGRWPDLKPDNVNGKGDNYPIYYVTYEDVQDFLTELNKQSGKSYRLPTESEWEFAAHGGLKSKGYTYSGSNSPDDINIYYGIAKGTFVVGTKAPNELGLYNLSGNVWEWTSDWFGPYTADAQTNPTGPATGTHRVIRGGTWVNTPYGIRVTARYGEDPEDSNKLWGFRVAHDVE
ncbi:MAG: Serine/threonine-protein kinase pkn1 [Candidatus Ordinivivax streblomastigis]|uniref:Serine/threonine-protein kinase pkn1 n=1 Tax=Candidatus Ordinivivax streblomastigis TaxID=2540710 RepID=A0A5M8NZ32_9BACT|nr:MAG: Serine/threonine-protein kinase pkn1 [Candidatus Ordinivivax streblomastigis]